MTIPRIRRRSSHRHRVRTFTRKLECARSLERLEPREMLAIGLPHSLVPGGPSCAHGVIADEFPAELAPAHQFRAAALSLKAISVERDLAPIAIDGIECLAADVGRTWEEWEARGLFQIDTFRENGKSVLDCFGIDDSPPSISTTFSDGSEEWGLNIFISYSHDDLAFTQTLSRRLSEHGADVWFDSRMHIGEPIESKIVAKISQSDAVLAVLSNASVESEWVDFELTTACAMEKSEGRSKVYPIALDGAWRNKDGLLWHQIRKRHVFDFSQNEQAESLDDKVDELVRQLGKRK